MKKTTMERKTNKNKNVAKAVLVLGAEEQHAGEGGHSRRPHLTCSCRVHVARRARR